MSIAGANQYTFHLESSDEPECVINLIRDANMKVGLAIKPNTNVEDLLPFIDKIDVVLIMTVEPGFGGQKFIQNMTQKIEFLRSRFAYLDIEVDGGINPQTAELCAKAGANMIVAGTSIIQSDNRSKIIQEIKDCCIRSYKN
ncbi:hypothetical protein HZS_5208 [Henneguya salminicola]|nr:hypothetical protein HZS_5208 [Henneguya salminicola]